MMTTMMMVYMMMNKEIKTKERKEERIGQREEERKGECRERGER